MAMRREESHDSSKNISDLMKNNNNDEETSLASTPSSVEEVESLLVVSIRFIVDRFIVVVDSLLCLVGQA